MKYAKFKKESEDELVKISIRIPQWLWKKWRDTFNEHGMLSGSVMLMMYYTVINHKFTNMIQRAWEVGLDAIEKTSREEDGTDDNGGKAA